MESGETLTNDQVALRVVFASFDNQVSFKIRINNKNLGSKCILILSLLFFILFCIFDGAKGKTVKSPIIEVVVDVEDSVFLLKSRACETFSLVDPTELRLRATNYFEV